MSDLSLNVVVHIVDYPPRLNGPAGDTLAATLSDVATEFVLATAQGYDTVHDDAHSAAEMEKLIALQLSLAAADRPGPGYRRRLVQAAATAVATIQRWDRAQQRATSKPALPDEVTRWLRKAIGELMGRNGEAAIAAVSPRMLVGALLVAPTMESLEVAIRSRWGVSLVLASGNTVADVAAAIVTASQRSAV